MIVCLLVFSAPAHAAWDTCGTCAKQNDFFDYGYAARMWEELDTRDKFWTEWNRVFPVAKAAYDAGLLKGTIAEMREAIKDRDDATEIMQGYDLWIAQSKVWSPSLRDQPGRSYGSFNNSGGDVAPRSLACSATIRRNIFTHQCFDLPDWRADELAAADTAEFNEIQQSVAERKAADAAAKAEFDRAQKAKIEKWRQRAEQGKK
ncbi:hypothetical protein J4E05_09310 [Thalassospira sp. NFXS8]|uniref:hypothetical protein n=1 Tax=Thalassospira sp. NFXS8 TaxID=2819093 RepID=UPI0032DFFD15